MTLAEKICQWLRPLRIWPYRLTFQMDIKANYEIPRLRGVWGRALRLLNSDVYETVFNGDGPVNLQIPHYIIRPGETLTEIGSEQRRVRQESIDFITWGVNHDQRKILMRAWDIASGMGIGQERYPFILRTIETPFSFVEDEGISLVSMIEQRSILETHPCRINFPFSVRIKFNHKSLTSLQLSDIIHAALLRISILRLQALNEFDALPEKINPVDLYPSFSEEVLEEVQQLETGPWTGTKIAIRRYSGHQKKEIDLYGCVGGLELPNGCGQLGPLLMASQILHLGKSTTLGIGQLIIQTQN